MISIVIPSFNSEQTIVKAIKSVLDQSYKNWEIIVVDDGSTDNTVTVLTSFLNEINFEFREKIKLICQNNAGPSKARNVGVEISKGEFIAFLDSDDYWCCKFKLEIQKDFFDKDSKLALCGGGHEEKRINSGIGFKIITFNMLLLKNYFATPTVMIKKCVFNQYKFDLTKKFSEDFKLWLQVCSQYKCIYINEVFSKNQFGKLRYGEAGLSQSLYLMEIGELSTYYSIYRLKLLGPLKFLAVISFSLVKYIIRIFKFIFFKIFK